MTIEDMADHLGIARNTIGNYLSGRTTPKRSILIAWALRTGVPLGYLERGEIPAEPDDGGGVVTEA